MTHMESMVIPHYVAPFRPIGINRNNFLACVQIRPYAPEEIRSIEWIAYGSNTFNAFVPFYVNIDETPDYTANTNKTVSTDNFYWANRIIGALADAHYSTTSSAIERYQNAVQTKGHQIIKKYDAAFNKKCRPCYTLPNSEPRNHRHGKTTDK